MRQVEERTEDLQKTECPARTLGDTSKLFMRDMQIFDS